jgi:hypothetical protein
MTTLNDALAEIFESPGPLARRPHGWCPATGFDSPRYAVVSPPFTSPEMHEGFLDKLAETVVREETNDLGEELTSPGVLDEDGL